MRSPALLLVLLLAAPAGPVAAQGDARPRQDPLLSIAALPGSENRASLHVGPVLNEASLSDALRSGLPIRMQFRVELWKDELVDDLEGGEEFVVVLRYEPIEERYLVYEHHGTAVARSYDSYAAARAAVERDYTLDLRPRRRGRYYYLASVRVETLALSDLEELETWLQGELRPAVGGDRNVFTAIGQGAKRLLIRVLGLPARHLEARTEPFTVR